MKKLLSLVLALALALSLSVTAFAASPITSGTGTDTGTITATVAAASTPGTVYYVEVTWGALSFTYVWGDKTWDPANLVYTAGQFVGWTLVQGSSITDSRVIVTNKSNTAITTTLAAASTGVTNIGTTVVTGLAGNAATKTLGKASSTPDNNSYSGTGTATSAYYTLGLEGAPTGTIAAGTTLFNLTLTIA